MPNYYNNYNGKARASQPGGAESRAGNGGRGGQARQSAARSPREGYSEGNSSWNTESYNRSVRTERTYTRVINPERRNGGSYYYDNTPAAVKARQKKEFEQRRTAWKKAVRKNKRFRKIKRALTSFLIISVTVAVAFTLVYKLLFVTKNITVEGSARYSDEEIIAACGLTGRTNLYSFSSRTAGEKMKFYCPFVAETVFDRKLPDNLSITVIEEEPVFYVNVFGNCYSVSDSLRVLEKIEQPADSGLIKLKLQSVSRAVSGSKIEMSSQRAQRFLENTVNLLNKSELKKKITAIDLTSDFDIVMVADGLYRLEFGTQEDLDVKIRLADAILKDELFSSGNRAYVDLRDTSKTSVVIDNQLTLD